MKFKINIKKFIVFLYIVLLFEIGCSDAHLKQAVKNYKGDGSIKYLKSPPLGKTGVLIQMPTFDLSKDHRQTYSLNGIPKGNNYIIYLVVPDSPFKEKIVQGLWIVRLKKGEGILFDASSKLKDLVLSQTGGKNLYYFDTESRFSITQPNGTYSVEVLWKNSLLIDPVEAYVMILRGGSK